MIFRRLHRIFVVIAGLLAVGAASAQSLKAGASVDRRAILIGEQIRLTLSADIPESEPIRFFSIDTLPHFEIVDRPPVDTTNTTEGTLLKQVLVITSFDSGHWVIPALTLGNQMLTDSIPVDVSFAAFDTTRPYNDISDIIDVEIKDEDPYWWLWYAIGGAGVLLIVLLFVFTRKKKPAPPAPEPVINAYEEAVKALDRLRNSPPDRKQFYAELADIFRLYIFRKKGIMSLQKTTDDLVAQLRGLRLPAERFDQLAQTLRLTDFVKFAKYVPGTDEDQRHFEAVLMAIRDIELQKDAV